MKVRPTIFLSGVSHELGTFRDAVENEIEMKGCFAENQPGFAPDYRTVAEMLTRRLHDADAVIHIVGFRFGAEPHQRPADAPRRSYTQMELDIARQLEKPVYVFISADPTVRDVPKPDEQPEDPEAAALQVAHREAVQKTNHLYYFFRDKAELCRLAAEIPPVQAAGFRVDISRIVKYAPAELIGREDELAILEDAWTKVRKAESARPHVLTFVALGGEGKTSLVAKWVADLAYRKWPACDAAFAWSFYSQGTREQVAASSDIFLKEALIFFGDAETAGSSLGAFEKGRRLAQLVGERRALLILDGLEPLQYAPTSPTPGELKDQGVAALLKALAASNQGLCIVTTRYAITDLRVYRQTTAPMHELLRLSTAAGVELLRSIGVTVGSQSDFEQLVEDTDGHALTLQIVGQFLVRAHRGDVRRRDRIEFDKANARIQAGHAFRAMDAYVKWMEDGSEEARRELAVLKLLGLFDRPATADCVDALREAPAIPGLTEPLVGLAEDDWEFSLTSLGDAHLLTVNRKAAGELITLDAHPLVREYFARRLRQQQPEAWQAAHERLYRHLCETSIEGDEPSLEALQPLYQAVGHGCHAGLEQEACDEVFFRRLRRRNENYACAKLGAYGSDLGAVAHFFDPPWTRVSPRFNEADQAWLMAVAAFDLRSLGRLTEVLALMRSGLAIELKRGDWVNARITTRNLSELELLLGEVSLAIADAERSMSYADRTDIAVSRQISRANYGDVLHQADRQDEAEVHFREAEQIKANEEPEHPLLHSVPGFQYCDLLLTHPERAAWKRMLGSSHTPRRSLGVPGKSEIKEASVSGPVFLMSSPDEDEDVIARGPQDALIDSCRGAFQRATTALRWAEGMRGSILIDFALHHLTLGRAALYVSILEDVAVCSRHIEAPGARRASEDIMNRLAGASSELEAAVNGLRRAGVQDYLPRGLLARAWLRVLTRRRIGPESAQSDLDEACEIAERGPMPLYLADIHLHRARLFGPPSADGPPANYPWTSPQADLAEARRLIMKHGYLRRMEELEDAEAAASSW